MSKEKTPMEWADFTNKFLGILGKFVLLPLVVLGGLISLFDKSAIGVLIMFGATALFLLAALLILAFKPLIVKKYPEPKLEIQPVSIWVDVPGEAPREETVMTSGKYRVSRSTPRKNMTGIQKLAADKCNGDIEAALHYLFTYMSEEIQVAYTKNITPRESEAYISLINIRSSELPPKELKQILKQAVDLTYLDMTEEQIMAAKNNPFVPKLWGWIGGLLAACVVIGMIVGLGRRFVDDGGAIEVIASLLGCGTTFFAYKVVESLMNSIRFSKVKHTIENETAK